MMDATTSLVKRFIFKCKGHCSMVNPEGPPPPPPFLLSYKNEKNWSLCGQIISFPWDISEKIRYFSKANTYEHPFHKYWTHPCCSTTRAFSTILAEQDVATNMGCKNTGHFEYCADFQTHPITQLRTRRIK